jgi:uncharacterized membrane protein YciS (DUF1049 family)
MRFAIFVCIAALLLVLGFAGLNRDLISQDQLVDLGFAHYRVLLFPVTVLIAAALILLVLLTALIQAAFLRRKIRRLEQQLQRARTDLNLESGDPELRR